MLNLLAAASEATSRGSRLAQLYLDRCFPSLRRRHSQRSKPWKNQIQDLREGS